jgi:hypothetical protein
MVVNPIRDAIEDEAVEAWVAAESCCDYCAYRWVAVYPVGCTQLECPSCGIMNTPRSGE